MTQMLMVTKIMERKQGRAQRGMERLILGTTTTDKKMNKGTDKSRYLNKSNLNTEMGMSRK